MCVKCSEVVERLATDIRARYQPQTDVFMDDLEEIIAPRLHEWREQIKETNDNSKQPSETTR